MENDGVVPVWQILSWISGVLGFLISLTLLILKFRETNPTVMMLPSEKGYNYFTVRLHNTSKHPITITKVACQPADLISHADAERMEDLHIMNKDAVHPAYPFWLLPNEEIKFQFWYQIFPDGMKIRFHWRSQGTWGIPRLPLMVRRSQKDLKLLQSARYRDQAGTPSNRSQPRNQTSV